MAALLPCSDLPAFEAVTGWSTPCGVGNGMAVCVPLQRLVVSNDEGTLEVFELPPTNWAAGSNGCSGFRRLGVLGCPAEKEPTFPFTDAGTATAMPTASHAQQKEGGAEGARVDHGATDAAAPSPPRLAFDFGGASGWSGLLCFNALRPHHLLVPAVKDHAVHLVDVNAGTHEGYLCAPGTLLRSPRAVAASTTHIAVVVCDPLGQGWGEAAVHLFHAETKVHLRAIWSLDHVPGASLTATMLQHQVRCWVSTVRGACCRHFAFPPSGTHAVVSC